MSERREPLDEKTLRETRAELVGSMADQARLFGNATPDIRKLESFIDPILHKVEVDHEEERRRSAPAPVPEGPEREKERAAGEWYGEPGHSPRVPEPLADESVRVVAKEIGTYDLNRDTGAITPRDGAPTSADDPNEGPFTKLARETVRALMQHAEWAHAFKRVMFECALHLKPQLRTCLRCQRRERLNRQLLAKAIRQYGDPRKSLERKIIVT